ncbi:hypothetical protein BAE44_0017989 [Dichanthelium oligosanthes]|uniref:F-box domain-containing protein n=1 Tax=Dichanthelium oligosanthes TaxID=888268 RepID=A0A1E5V7A1_9POAL|nr:hypothetical protein BAE44_0017989 [Dichanthelium oligosanthes]
MPPEQSAKRACAESLSGDRLSALPDGVLHAVLSFLPAPQAVRTSALSRRWRRLWRTSPCVNIDAGEFGIAVGCSDLERKRREFEDFTTSLLLFCSGTVPLDRLKRLHLIGVGLESHFAEQIRSGCPVLEDLELRSCSHNFQEIASCSLKRLVIHTLSNDTRDHFVVRAPCVVYLQMIVSYACYSNGISVHRSLLVDLCNVPTLELRGVPDKETGTSDYDPQSITAPRLTSLRLLIWDPGYSKFQ